MLAENFIFVKEHFHLNHIYQILLRTKKRRVWFFYDSLFLLRAASIHFAENLFYSCIQNLVVICCRASMRLAYQDMSLERKKQEEKLKASDPKKAQQLERLGMGFISNKLVSS